MTNKLESRFDIFANRLKRARKMKGFTLDDLSYQTQNNVSKNEILKYESGMYMADSTNLIYLSKALNQPVDYFFREIKCNSIHFRKKLNISEQIKEKILDYIERYLEIEEIVGNQITLNDELKIKNVSNEYQVKYKAKSLRRKWDLGSDGIVSVINMLEERGIKVIEIDGCDDFDGTGIIINDNIFCIVLNTQLLSEKKRFIALFELAYFIFEFNNNILPDKKDMLCRIFASEMLIPDDIFQQALGNKRVNISYYELCSLQEHYGISCDELMYKASICGIIDECIYKNYCVQKDVNLDIRNKLERSFFIYDKPNRFQKLVYLALCKNLISISKAAVLLNNTTNDICSNVDILPRLKSGEDVKYNNISWF